MTNYVYKYITSSEVYGSYFVKRLLMYGHQ